jgi:hypothetical protein
MTRGVESASSELGHAFPIHDAQIHSGSCTGSEDPTPEYIPGANDGHSEIPEISGLYAQRRDAQYGVPRIVEL